MFYITPFKLEPKFYIEEKHDINKARGWTVIQLLFHRYLKASGQDKMPWSGQVESKLDKCTATATEIHRESWFTIF